MKRDEGRNPWIVALLAAAAAAVPTTLFAGGIACAMREGGAGAKAPPRITIAEPAKGSSRSSSKGRWCAPTAPRPPPASWSTCTTPTAPAITTSQRGEPPRLRGWMRTDSAGRYAYRTIRPAPYPGSPQRRARARAAVGRGDAAAVGDDAGVRRRPAAAGRQSGRSRRRSAASASSARRAATRRASSTAATTCASRRPATSSRPTASTAGPPARRRALPRAAARRRPRRAAARRLPRRAAAVPVPRRRPASAWRA